MLGLKVTRICMGVLLIYIFNVSNGISQVNITPEALSYYNACMNYAISHNFVKSAGGRVKYSCQDNVAYSYFNYLGGRSNDRQESQRRGTFIFRDVGSSGTCWHLIADASGNGASQYGCELRAAAPPD